MQSVELVFVLVSVLFTVLLAAGAATAIVVRVRLPKRGTVIAEYEPPAGLAIVEAAHLESVSHRAVQATLVDLAIRRHVRIFREPNGAFLLQAVDLGSLTDLELRVIHIVFGMNATAGSQRRARGRENRSATRWRRAVARLDAAARRSLEGKSLLLKRRSGSMVAPFALTVLVLSFTLPAALVFAIQYGFSVVVAATNLYGVAVVVALFGLGVGVPLPISAAGAALRDRLAGLKLFITIADADRLRMLQGANTALVDSAGIVLVYQKLLPFAVLWGLERDWARLLQHHTGAELDWWFESGDDFVGSLAALGFAISSDTDAGGGSDGTEPGDPSDASADGIDGGDGDGDGGGGDGGGGDGGGGGD